MKMRTSRLLFWGVFLLFSSPFILFIAANIRDWYRVKDEFPQIIQSLQAEEGGQVPVYSSDGKVLFTLYAHPQITYQDLPPALVKGLIALEDPTFYQHIGFDEKLYRVLMLDLLAGITHYPKGLPSISQNVARTLSYNKGRNLYHMSRYFAFAILLEKNLTKEEIVTLYFNCTYFHRYHIGIEATSQRLFRCATKDLSLSQIALLLVLKEGPSYYDPFHYPARAIEKRNMVLQKMAEADVFSRKWLDSLKQTPLVVYEEEPLEQEINRSLKNEILAELAVLEKQHDLHLYENGVAIYTAIDSRLQSLAEATAYAHTLPLQHQFIAHNQSIKIPDSLLDIERNYYKQNLNNWCSESAMIEEVYKTKAQHRLFVNGVYVDTLISPKEMYEYYARQLSTAFCALDPQTGEIKAYFSSLQGNFSPYADVCDSSFLWNAGSLAKPILYSCFLEKGISPCISPIRSFKKAIEYSMGAGIPLDKEWKQALQPADYKEMAQRLGVKTDSNALTYTHMLVVSLKSVVGMYAVFANEGKYYAPHIITHIQTDNKVYETTPSPKQVLSQKIAAGMREILCYNLSNTYNIDTHLSRQYPVNSALGGKNGYVANGTSVSFAGITPTLCGVVWTGGGVNGFPFSSLQMQSKAATPIWYDFIHKAEVLSLIPVATFPKNPKDMPVLECEAGNLNPAKATIEAWE